MSDNIDWSKAPEGATHYCDKASYSWLRDSDHPDFFNEDRGEWRAYGRAEYGKRHIAESVPRPLISEGPLRAEEFDHLVQPEAHTDDLAVDAFARAMGTRLAQCRAAGRSGWDDPEQCPPQRLAEGLVRAVRAGKLVDVGNYAMMLWKRADRAQVMARVPGWIGEALERREPVEWDGTGLPPVGAVCEWRGHGGSWESANIAAHVTKRSGTSFVLFELPNDYWHWESDPKRLRPILTPEQRAAKERDEAVAAMLADAEVVPFGSEREEDMARALYAAGWRKTEGE